MKLKSISIFSLIVFSACSYAMTAVELNSIVENAVKKYDGSNNSGIFVSVFNSKEVYLKRGFGFKNKETKEEVSDNTLFAIGSTTKAFTSLDLLLLANQNKFKFSDKVNTVLPSFKLSNDFINEQVNFEDLLSHRIGLPRHDLLWYLTPFTRVELLNKLQYLDFPEKAESKFRNTFQYNNLMFMSAGLAVENLSGKNWEIFTKENILNVLGMTSTKFGLPENREGLDLATPYAGEEKLEHKIIESIGPAGDIYSNGDDMTKWIQSYLQKKWANQDKLLGIKSLMALDKQGTTDPRYGYGLGWMVNEFNPNAKLYFHGGNIDGFSTEVLFSNDLDLGIVIFINQDGSPVPDQIISDVVVAKLKELKTGQNKSLLRELKLLPKNFRDLEVLGGGDLSNSATSKIQYTHPAYGEIKIAQDKDQTIIDYYGYKWILGESDKPEFKYKGTGLFDIYLNWKNDILEIPFEPQVHPIRFEIEK